MFRCLYKSVCRKHPIFSKHTIERAPEGGVHLGLVRLSVEPTLEEAANHAVPSPEPRHARTNRLNDTGTVREWYKRKLLPGTITALHRQEIAVIQRRGLEAHEHLLRPGTRHRLFDECHTLDAVRTLEFIYLHSFFSRACYAAYL